MMQLKYSGSKAYIRNAVTKANEILLNPLLYQQIAQHPQMDNTAWTSARIADYLQNAAQKITVDTYWKPKFLTKANATTSGPNLTKLNTARFSHILTHGVRTLIHESVHAADFLDGSLDFTHFDNNPDGEDNTAPWVIGAIASSMV
jgi:hypothetical protein